jgi:hypothetical protein
MAEEALSALWLIAALLAYIAGIKWLAVALFIKAALDTIAAIHFAVTEAKSELSSKEKAEG